MTATTVVLGALATRDWRPMHHDKDFAVNRNGTRDIFLNTPNQAAWFERFVTDWTGPYGRLQRMTFRMLGSIFPGDTMVFSGVVTDTGVDETGCGSWPLDIAVSVDGRRQDQLHGPGGPAGRRRTTIPGPVGVNSGVHDPVVGGPCRPSAPTHGGRPDRSTPTVTRTTVTRMEEN